GAGGVLCQAEGVPLPGADLHRAVDPVDPQAGDGAGGGELVAVGRQRKGDEGSCRGGGMGGVEARTARNGPGLASMWPIIARVWPGSARVGAHLVLLGANFVLAGAGGLFFGV